MDEETLWKEIDYHVESFPYLRFLRATLKSL